MLTLVMAWIAMTYLGVDGITNGDPDILLNGIDYDGRICGVDTDVKDKPKVGGCGAEEGSCYAGGDKNYAFFGVRDLNRSTDRPRTRWFSLLGFRFFFFFFLF